jgi:hypothetical protein
VLAILEANPGFKYALVTDSDADPGGVVVHIGIRDVGFGGIVIAKARYDGLELLKSLEAQVAQAAAARGPEIIAMEPQHDGAGHSGYPLTPKRRPQCIQS